MSLALRPAAMVAAQAAGLLEQAGLAAFRAERAERAVQLGREWKHGPGLATRRRQEAGRDHVPLQDAADRRDQ